MKELVKPNNDEKIKIYRKRKLLRISTIIFTILTILFSLLSLIMKITPIPAVICFVIEILATKYSEKINYKK